MAETRPSSPDAFASPAPLPPASRGSGRRTATRIAIGCGGLILLVVAIVGGFAYWAIVPETQVPTRGIITEKSAAYVHVRDLSADPAAREFLIGAMRALEKVGNATRSERLPPTMRWLESMRDTSEQASTAISFVTPKDVSFALEFPEEDEPKYSVAANPRFFTRLIRYALQKHSRNLGESREDIEGTEVMAIDTVRSLATLGGTFVLSDHSLMLADGIRGLRAAGKEPRPGFDQLAGEWPIFGEATGRALRGLTDGMNLSEEQFRGLRSMSLGVKFRSADSLLAQFHHRTDNADTAQAVGVGVTAALEGLRERWKEFGLTMTVKQNVQPNDVQTDVDLSGLITAVERITLATLEKEKRNRPRQR